MTENEVELIEWLYAVGETTYEFETALRDFYRYSQQREMEDEAMENSNDLISRSVLLEEINNFSMRIAGSVNAMAITVMEETKKSIAKMINEQPNAYDVDKVIERLSELNGNEFYYANVISIIRSGGHE